MEVHKDNDEKNKKSILVFSFFSPLIKIHTHFHFCSCVTKKSVKSIFGPPHQSTSKKFNQIGKNVDEKFREKIGFGFGF